MRLLSRYRQRPLLLFTASLSLCGAIEYIASYLMETLFHARWWDYSAMPLNINGRICLPVLLCFGLAGVAVVRWGAPFIQKRIAQFSGRTRRALCIALCALFLLDLLFSFIQPNMGVGIGGLAG